MLRAPRAVASFCVALLAISAFAGAPGLEVAAPSGAANTKPRAIEGVDLVQNVGAELPATLPFVDETGATTTLGAVTRGLPTLLTMVYYDCPSLCGMLIGGVFRTMKESNLTPGKDFQVVFVSIHPKETPTLAASKKKAFVDRYGFKESAAGIHFLTGTKENIDVLAKVTGFSYRWDEETKQYSHPGMLVVGTADGHIARYYAGVEFKGRDVRLSLVEASGNKIGSPIDHFFLFCYRYDPSTGKYGLAVFRSLRFLGIVTVFAIAALVFLLSRRRGSQLRPVG